jgi:hypothetical protein
MHKLCMPNATLVRLVEPFEFLLQEVEPLDVHYDSGLACCMRSREIVGPKGAAQPMARHHRINPGEAIKMVSI